MNLCRLIAAAMLIIISLTACAPLDTQPTSEISSKPPPQSIEQLRSTTRNIVLHSRGKIEGGQGFTAELFAYESAGLTVHALVARPQTPTPAGGFPVLIANHGHHPEPPKYGITADGKDWRPGDYYRQIPKLFTARGYVVAMPDYRGHNNSQGFKFTEGLLESAYYSEDVLNLMDGLADLKGLNHEQYFMWGHSMGGEVTLRTLLATDRIKAASMWSSVGGDIWDQAYYYSRYLDSTAPDSSETDKAIITRLRGRITQLSGDFDAKTIDPALHIHYLQTPLIIHHAVEDKSAAYKWSVQLAKELYMAQKRYEFWSYGGSDHLFSGKDLELAVERDDTYFRSLIQ